MTVFIVRLFVCFALYFLFEFFPEQIQWSIHTVVRISYTLH